VTTSIAICSAQALPATAIPEWLHLLPSGTIKTADGRGPYRVQDAKALMSASMAGGKLVLDENHATDLAAPKGLPAPARGWIVELQQRLDGIWGRVEWTPEGRRMMGDRQYRGVSPVIQHNLAGTVGAIVRASLTNTPNFTGLVSLHSEGKDKLRQWLIATLPIKAEDGMDLAGKEATGLLAQAAEEALGPDDEMNAADKDMARRMNLDPAAFLDAKKQGSTPGAIPGFRTHLAMMLKESPSATNGELLEKLVAALNASGVSYADLHSAKQRQYSEAEQSVMGLLGIDALDRKA
jgi:phage I-like protein